METVVDKKRRKFDNFNPFVCMLYNEIRFESNAIGYNAIRMQPTTSTIK